VTEYTALQLAKKLGDTRRLGKYLSLVNHYDEALILEGFINMQSRDLAGEELDIAFDRELAALTMKDDNHAL
jgi:hypothetical protein